MKLDAIPGINVVRVKREECVVVRIQIEALIIAHCSGNGAVYNERCIVVNRETIPVRKRSYNFVDSSQGRGCEKGEKYCENNLFHLVLLLEFLRLADFTERLSKTFARLIAHPTRARLRCANYYVQLSFQIFFVFKEATPIMFTFFLQPFNVVATLCGFSHDIISAASLTVTFHNLVRGLRPN